MFLISAKSEAHCSYKIVLIKKRVVFPNVGNGELKVMVASLSLGTFIQRNRSLFYAVLKFVFSNKVHIVKTFLCVYLFIISMLFIRVFDKKHSIGTCY